MGFPLQLALVSHVVHVRQSLQFNRTAPKFGAEAPKVAAPSASVSPFFIIRCAELDNNRFCNLDMRQSTTCQSADQPPQPPLV